MSELATRAGKGNHYVYKIASPEPQDEGSFIARKHYLAVDAVAWYVNKDSNWLKEKTASGTLEITLSGGLENYQAALGTFKLKSGSKVAPIFDIPILPDRNYRGGPIIFNISLCAIKNDRILGRILKSAADASLNIVSGMVETAGLTGPSKILTSAGNELINGVKGVLSDNTEKYEPLFDSGGLRFGLYPQDITGSQIYLLFHRGAKL
jgi:hypothetical protein